jgi:hypothetical protein
LIEKRGSASSAIGEIVLPTAPPIGARNAALGGAVPRMGAITILTWSVPPTTISIRKPD